ncbi:MAG TPA: efflux RND transporter periplasmic adaptor subunit [Flexilinea sp.]|jgi:multidrug resistance efflux pump|nr:efflux RND transporter periplasmic adaptor subunit [Flexilinea sp.]HOG61284.1 efflux RND transporter periplasmic adaptor subunit [Flexilinea sp.]HOR56001.1 efflux RND transporter periplasmic adaptor subunit [Flexilinea sp.]HOU18961.1 efflux RND transporter periplasmic adaptor subunit [Flexilinea sp.]
MKKKSSIGISLFIILCLFLSGCENLNGQSTSLKASGTISAVQVDVAPQIGGTVVSVSTEEGAQVKKGDELFRIDDSLLKAQRDQADASVTLAESALATAKTQYDLAVDSARQQERQTRINSWNTEQSSQFKLPVWYFDKTEKLASAKVEMDAAKADLDEEKASLEKILNDKASAGFLNAEKRLANAEASFLIADQVLTQATNAKDKEELQDFAQDQYDTAKTELDSAQSNYDRLLTTQAAKDVLEGRARVRVTQERYDRALDYYNSLLSGDQSLQVKVAESNVSQAEAGLKQAQAALSVIDVQLEKTIVKAPVDGIILARNIEVGETIAPNAVVLTVGQLENVNLTVYIPETEYGKVKLNEKVSIQVDSFPDETFTGAVVYISDQAEFTPRNVQTMEGRRTTVYAVKIDVPNPDLKLKPGMPADVTFEEK